MAFNPSQPAFLRGAAERYGAALEVNRASYMLDGDTVFVIRVDTALESAAGRLTVVARTDARNAWEVRPEHPYDVSIEVAVPEAGELSFELEAGTLFFGLLFLQDLQLGDAAFDDRYIVRGNHLELLSVWLDAPVRAAVMATYDPVTLHPCRIRLDGGVLRLQASLGIAHVATFESIVAAAIAIADQPRVLAEAWVEALAGLDVVATQRWAFDSDFRLRWRRPDGDVSIDPGFAPSWEGGAARWMRTRVRAARTGGGGGRFVIHRDDLARRRLPDVAGKLRPVEGDLGLAWQARAEEPAALAALAAALRTRLADLAAVSIAGDNDEIVAVLPGIVRDPDEIARVARAISVLTGGTSAALGVYR